MSWWTKSRYQKWAGDISDVGLGGEFPGFLEHHLESLFDIQGELIIDFEIKFPFFVVLFDLQNRGHIICFPIRNPLLILC